MSTDTYDVVVVAYGSRAARRREVFLNDGADPRADEEIGMDYCLWVVRNERRTIVVDTGFSVTAGIRRGRTVHADPVALLDRLGAGPSTAPIVVITHAHYDHLGNLSAFDRSPVHIARAEFDFWAGPMAARGEFAALTEPGELEVLRAAHADGRVALVDDGHQLAPGVRLHVVGGHTPGQLMVEVRGRQGTVLLASDALHYAEELERDVPFAHLADLADTYVAFDRIRAARDAGALVVPGHDPIAGRSGRALAGFDGLVTEIHTYGPSEGTEK